MRISLTLGFAVLLAGLAGCEEKPAQQLVQSEEVAQQRDQRSTESDRIYNQGGLR